jgi:adenylate kinase
MRLSVGSLLTARAPRLAETLIVLLGPTGAGKTVQAKILASTGRWVHISTGDLLRRSPDPELQTIIDSGQLAPSSAVEQLLEEALEEIPSGQRIILDGFPRMLDEAEWLDGLLQKLQRPLTKVLLLEVDAEESRRRLEARGRADDAPDALARKWDEYRRDTLPVLDRYRQRGLLTSIDGMGNVEEVAGRVQQALTNV